jgi:hypothetical protein
MASIIDIYRHKADEYFKGWYYQKRPNFLTQNPFTGIQFAYTIKSDSDRSVADLLDNLATPETFMIIKTDDPLPLPDDLSQEYRNEQIPLGYVVTDDGFLWAIQSLATKIVHDKGNQALRIRKKALKETKHMRLVKISNLQGVQ